MRKIPRAAFLVAIGLVAAFFASREILIPAQVEAPELPSAGQELNIERAEIQPAKVQLAAAAVSAPAPLALARPSPPKADAKTKVDKAPRAHYPARLLIPSINLNAPIEYMGINEKGEMDVPSGKTKNVGWYQYGTVPGKEGSAVIDAHVFAAFATLNQVKLGSDIFVITNDGSKLHFTVDEARTYAMEDVPLDTLFNRKDAIRLNLITCAGKPTPDGSTYTHRLVVYAMMHD